MILIDEHFQEVAVRQAGAPELKGKFIRATEKNGVIRIELWTEEKIRTRCKPRTK